MTRFDALALERAFRVQMNAEQVDLYFPDSNKELGRSFLEKLAYAFDGRGVYAYEKEGGRVLAYAYGLPKEMHERILRSVPFQSRCLLENLMTRRKLSPRRPAAPAPTPKS